MIVKLVAYKGKGGLFNALVRFWTRSPYSHCEVWLAGTCYSSSIADKGVRPKQIDIKNGSWGVYDIPWANPADVLAYYTRTQHHPYGFLDLVLRNVLRIPSRDGKGQFCSEWCANALGLPDARDHSPASLVRLCQRISEAVGGSPVA